MKKVFSLSLVLILCLSALISLLVCYAETDDGDNTISYTDGESFINPVANGADPFVYKEGDILVVDLGETKVRMPRSFVSGTYDPKTINKTETAEKK